jgi:hypothetical protein
MDIVPEENQPEFLYSALLQDIMELTDRLLSDKGSWRTLELYLYNFGS